MDFFLSNSTLNRHRKISRKLNCWKGWRLTPFSLTSCFLATLKTRASSITAKNLSTRLSVIILEAFLVLGLTSTNFFPVRNTNTYMYVYIYILDLLGFTLSHFLPLNPAKFQLLSSDRFEDMNWLTSETAVINVPCRKL